MSPEEIKPGFEGGSPLDPANQSLAEALRVMYRLLQAGMMVLLLLFTLSGVTWVNEGELGVRLLFGKVRESDLKPGFRWSAPYPLGQLEKISTGVRDVTLDRSFWVFIQPGTVDPSLDKLTPQDALKPDEGGSGSVITGDGNIAHTQWRVTFSPRNAALYSQNMTQESAIEIVRATAMRGIVRACAQVSIDDLLKQTATQAESVARAAQTIAQESLDAMGSGLEIEDFKLTQVTPPLYVRSSFAKMQNAVSTAAKELENASATRRTTLNAVAGDAATLLVGAPSAADRSGVPGLIDQYEDALERGNATEAALALERIESVLAGREIEVNGAKIGRVVSGEVAGLLADAEGYRRQVGATYQGELSRYQAKLAAFQANPQVMVQTEWRDAVGAFLARDTVQMILVPPGSEWVSLQLNADPDLRRSIDRAKKEREVREAEDKRRQMLRQEQFKTQTGLIEMGG
ncbi:MAG: hypothetical protein IPM33_04040 [Phycisphaerales bacterium]|nr:hypothetical protein [Phycisphaerales bacterium]